MKYYGFWRSLAACRVRIALALKGVAAEEISVNLMQGEQGKPEYLAINPLGVVPALVSWMTAPGSSSRLPSWSISMRASRSRRSCHATRVAVRECGRSPRSSHAMATR